jgi:hypothetical protein
VFTTTLNQTAGGVATTFNQAVNVAGNVDLNGHAFTINGGLTTTGGSGGSLTITNAGLLTIADTTGPTDTATVDISLDGPFLQDGAGAVSIAGDILTNNQPVSFDSPLTVTGDVRIGTNAGLGSITFYQTIDGVGTTDNLTIDAGQDDVAVLGVVGGTTPLDSLTIDGNDIQLSGIGNGSVGVDGDVTVTAVDVGPDPGRIFLGGTGVTDDYRSGGEQTYTAPTDGVVIQTAAAGAISAGVNDVTVNGDLYLDAAGTTISLLSDLSISGRLVGYRGTWDISGRTISVGDDLALFGANYEPDDLDFVAGDNTYFEYPDLKDDISALAYFPFAAPGGGAYQATDALFYEDGTFASQVNTSFAFTGIGLNGATLNVAGDFYVNGLDLTAGADWNLTVSDNSGADPYADPNFRWGQPYAVFLYGQVSRSKIPFVVPADNGSIAAATVSGGHTNNNVVDGGNNDTWNWNGGSPEPGWDFTAPQITGSAIQKDDVVFIDMNVQVTNVDTDTGTAGLQGGINDRATNVFYDGGTLAFASTWQSAGTDMPADSTNNASPLGLDSFYLYTTNTRWNTDANGTSASASAGGSGTDRTGTQQTTVPDISWTKGAFHSAGGRNPSINYNRERANAAAAQPAPVWNGTLDEAGPVLHTIEYGRATSPATSAFPRRYDGHNFFHLYYSEPVRFGTATWADGDVLSGAENTQSQTSFAAPGETGGDIIDSPDQTGSVGRWTDVVGYFRYDADQNGDSPMERGTRDGTVAAGTANALYRQDTSELTVFDHIPAPMGSISQDQQLRIYLSGYSEGGDGQTFPGWHANVPDPDTAYGIDVVANPYIVDAQDNPVDHTVNTDTARFRSTTYASSVAPGPNVTADWLTAWDVDPPVFSSYNVDFGPDPNETFDYEIVSIIDIGNTDLVTALDFHILDNSAIDYGALDDAIDDKQDPIAAGYWDPLRLSPVAPPNDLLHINTRANEGVRDTTLNYPTDTLQEDLAFAVEQVGTTPVTTYNDGLETNTVDNNLFGNVGAGLNNSYFRLDIDENAAGLTWGNLTDLWVSYDETQAYITDLAGNLLRSTVTPIRVIERTPPRIELALARPGEREIFVQFSEPVWGNDSRDQPIDAGDFALISGSYTVTGLDILSTTTEAGGTIPGATAALLTLDSELTVQAIFEDRIGPFGTGVNEKVYDKANNAMPISDQRRLTDIGIGLVEPLWATDSSGINDAGTGEFRTIRRFDGSDSLDGLDITLQARFTDSYLQRFGLRLVYDVDVPDSRKVNGYWNPVTITAPLGEDPVPANTSATFMTPFEVDGVFHTYSISSADPRFSDGRRLEFLFDLGPLPAARLRSSGDLTSVAPWEFGIDGGFIRQRAGVTILNNVIFPENDERTVLTYEMERPGIASVIVFGLDGNVIRTIHRGRQGAGTYRYTWDGRNNSGQIVARGIYFIRVVAPGIDEYRKVIVAKD